MTPSGTSPQATNFHKATSNLRASATIILYGFLVNRVFQCMSFPQFKEGPWSRKPRDISRVTTLYSVDPIPDRNHDAVIRIEDLAPEWWAHSSDRHLCHGLLSGCHHPGSSWSDQRPSEPDR